jgi:hypothetical protein
MGGLREPVGNITIEARRESFIIHPGYGWRPKRSPIRELAPGDYFCEEGDEGGPLYVVKSISVHEVLYHLSEGGEQHIVPRDDTLIVQCDSNGLPVDSEEVEGSFAEHWRDAHPEFLNKDLDDMIQALQNLKDNPYGAR